jgi:hypothetical protein
MKYFITESRLNDFIIQYLNSWSENRYINGFDTFITITSRDETDDIEDEVDMIMMTVDYTLTKILETTLWTYLINLWKNLILYLKIGLNINLEKR